MKLINFREGKPYNITLILFGRRLWFFLYFAFRYLSFVVKIENLRLKNIKGYENEA